MDESQSGDELTTCGGAAHPRSRSRKRIEKKCIFIQKRLKNHKKRQKHPKND